MKQAKANEGEDDYAALISTITHTRGGRGAHSLQVKGLYQLSGYSLSPLHVYVDTGIGSPCSGWMRF